MGKSKSPMATAEAGSIGGQPKFTPTKFKALVDDYLKKRANLNQVPVVNHFAMFAGVSREQLYKHYRVADGYKEHYEKLVQARDGMTEFFLVNPDETRKGGSIIFAAKNYLGMTDKQEIEQKVTHHEGESLADKLSGGSLE